MTELRIQATKPAAVGTGRDGPRRRAVARKELPLLQLEMSVLSEPVRVHPVQP